MPAAVVIAVTILAGRSKKASSGEADSDSMGFIGGVLNALFTVVLAFYIVFAWQQGDNVSSQATAEANALTDTYWEVGVAPQPEQDRIRDLVKQYANEVADHEWAALDQGRTDPTVQSILNELRSAVSALPTDTDPVKNARDESLQDIEQIDINHGDRVDAATDGSTFTTFLLVGTIIGALAMLAFPLLIGLSARPSNLVGIVILTVVLAAIVFISVQLQHPLHGTFGVSPDSFHDVLAEIATDQ
jgi:hypothetical protein